MFWPQSQILAAIQDAANSESECAGAVASLYLCDELRVFGLEAGVRTSSQAKRLISATPALSAPENCTRSRTARVASVG
jgi:hypothetical protein